MAPLKGAVELHDRFSTVGVMQVLPFHTSKHFKALPTSQERLFSAFCNQVSFCRMVLDYVGDNSVFLITSSTATLDRTVVDKQLQMLCSKMLPGCPVVTRLCAALTAYPEIFWLACFPICPLAFANVCILFVLLKFICGCKPSFATKTLFWPLFSVQLHAVR